jgi:hypothetical protein
MLEKGIDIHPAISTMERGLQPTDLLCAKNPTHPQQTKRQDPGCKLERVLETVQISQATYEGNGQGLSLIHI